MGGDTTSARHRVLEQNKGWSLDAFAREVHVPFFKQRRSCEFDRSWLIHLETGSQVTVGKTLRERNSMPHGGSIARLDGSLEDFLQFADAKPDILPSAGHYFELVTGQGADETLFAVLAGELLQHVGRKERQVT